MKKGKVTICIGTVGSPTFKKCKDIIYKNFSNHPAVDKVIIIKNKSPQSEWLNEMRKACSDTEWCLQVDEDMYLYPNALDELIKIYKRNFLNGVKVLNASSFLYDLFLERKIGSLKLWSSQALQRLEFRDMLGGDRDYADRALRLGYKNVATKLVLGDHDSAPTAAIAFSKYFEYTQKIMKFSSREKAEDFVKSLKYKYEKDKKNYINKKAYDGAKTALNKKIKNKSKRSFCQSKKEKKILDINEYFDKIFYINLESRIDKKRKMEEVLAYNGVFAERFSAINGYSKINKKIYNNLKKTKYDVELGRRALSSPGALGCLMSVRSIIKKAKEMNLKKILLFDDDLIFSKNFNINIQKINELPSDWKLLYLGASQHSWSNIHDFNKNFYYAKNTAGTFAVGIDSSIFDEILNISSKFELPIDSYLERFIQKKYYKKCFVFKNNLIIADVTDSNIRDSQDQLTRSKKMKWNLSQYNFNRFKKRKIAIGVTTYNRISYLKEFIKSFCKTKNNYFNWTLIIADDGSTDGTIDYINKLNIKNVNVILIKNKRIGVHRQTNLIFKEFENGKYDFGFKCDDDIIFSKKGWDSLYIRASEKSKKDHLVYYGEEWRPTGTLSIMPQLEIESRVSFKDAMGCFWTFNQDLLSKVGNFDVENFGFRGQGHIDFTARCCRLGFNDIGSLKDAFNSNYYIRMQPRNNYISTIENSKEDKLSRDAFEKDRKNSIINTNRGFILCKKL